ncbi:MAG: outer membrane lipoprotein chaperone LolA [Ideonella sp.]|nr:outer membrane lipoprotein chaperone LolA [Ideonella sp.]MBL0151465.1 outer membrane lipoprotein chaperone LolA [Ideonella sp.]
MKARRKTWVAALLGLGALAIQWPAHADALDTLREFSRDVKSGRAEFTQTVTSPDGVKKKVSSGSFEFARPNRFRFAYKKPFEQLIVSDGKTVWLHDVDLNQVSIRPYDQALGATPAALLSGAGLERDFTLNAQPSRDGLDWVRAVPKVKGGNIESVQIGFKGHALAALELQDAFGQRSVIQFGEVAANVTIAEASFKLVPPKGADVVEQR